jgi:hypothetical protein
MKQKMINNLLIINEHIDQEPMKVYKLDELPEENVFVSELDGVSEED